MLGGLRQVALAIEVLCEKYDGYIGIIASAKLLILNSGVPSTHGFGWTGSVMELPSFEP
jgi:hypothetical protein